MILGIALCRARSCTQRSVVSGIHSVSVQAGLELIEGSLAEEDLGVLLDERLDMSQQSRVQFCKSRNPALSCIQSNVGSIFILQERWS